MPHHDTDVTVDASERTQRQILDYLKQISGLLMTLIDQNIQASAKPLEEETEPTVAWHQRLLARISR